MNRCGLAGVASITSTSTARRTKRAAATPLASPGASPDAENGAPRVPVARETQGAQRCHPLAARQSLSGRAAVGGPHPRNSASIRSTYRRSNCTSMVRPSAWPLSSCRSRQRHLAVERLATEPPDPPKPKSSLDYLAALRAEYQARQQRELGPLQFTQLPLPEVTCPLTQRGGLTCFKNSTASPACRFLAPSPPRIFPHRQSEGTRCTPGLSRARARLRSHSRVRSFGKSTAVCAPFAANLDFNAISSCISPTPPPASTGPVS